MHAKFHTWKLSPVKFKRGFSAWKVKVVFFMRPSIGYIHLHQNWFLRMKDLLNDAFHKFHPTTREYPACLRVCFTEPSNITWCCGFQVSSEEHKVLFEQTGDQTGQSHRLALRPCAVFKNLLPFDVQYCVKVSEWGIMLWLQIWWRWIYFTFMKVSSFASRKNTWYSVSGPL